MANTITVQRNTRLLQHLSGYQGCTILAPVFEMQPLGVALCIPPTGGLDYGRTVSISREYPPPKKR